MSQTTVFVILDAGRSDYLNPDTMPLLHGLARDSLAGQFDSPPGFAQRTVFFTGRYPDTSGNFSAFVYDPAASPFRWVRRLGPVGHAVRPRRAMVPARIGLKAMTHWLTGAYHADPAWIPPRFLPFFRPCEDMRPVDHPGALGATSIFDLCRQHGLRYRYLAHPVSGDDDAIHETLVRDLRDGSPCDLYVVQFSATDEGGHRHGPDSPTMRRRILPQIDQRLASIHAALHAGYDSWNLLVGGDHGMAPVRTRVNVLAALDQADAVPARDYVAFVNSTLLVLWYLTDRGEDEIERILPWIPGTQVLTDADRKRLRMPTDDRWGHRLVAARPGVLFWPDYFHVTDSTIEGMHGYLDRVEEGHGLCVLASRNGSTPRGDAGLRPLVDIFPTLCDLLGVPTPDGQEGVSLLRPRPDPARPDPEAAAPRGAVPARP